MTETTRAAVLYAVMDDDLDEAERLLGDFLPDELMEFERQIESLHGLIRTAFDDLRMP